MTKAHFDMMAAYNRWANLRLYEAVAGLSDADYFRDRRGFFKSIHGTLNHLLVGDRIWLRRFTGEGDAPTALDAILFDTFAPLRTAREAEDLRIVETFGKYEEDALAGTLSYRNTAGEPYEQPLATVLAHFFNHQTHHRGQAHDMVSQTGRKPPPLDLLIYMRETGI
jgi:uncharacterized damage-inducible protein DinB